MHEADSGDASTLTASRQSRYDQAPAHVRTPAGELPYHERLYVDGTCNFEEGDLQAAMNAFVEYLTLINEASVIDRHAPPYGLSGVDSQEAFENRFMAMLNEKAYRWAERGRLFFRFQNSIRRWQGVEPHPRFLNWLARTRPAWIWPKGKRILFLLPQYILNSSRYVECDMKDHLLESAANAGAEVSYLATDRMAYPELMGDSSSTSNELALLADRIGAFRPDVVFLDGNYVPSSGSLNPDFLRSLQATCPFKVIAFIGDAWSPAWIPAANKWGEIADAIYHFAPESPLETQCAHRDKLRWDAYLVNERNFFWQPRKKYDISFVGSYVSQLRPFWLTVALQAANERHLAHRLLPHQREKASALSMTDYAAVLRESHMVLNFSRRATGMSMMTGRTWQAFASGTLLLEEENAFTSAYFVPFVHYVPFATAQELQSAIRFFSRYRQIAARIGETARQHWGEHYSGEAIWARLLGAVLDPKAQSATTMTGSSH